MGAAPAASSPGTGRWRRGWGPVLPAGGRGRFRTHAEPRRRLWCPVRGEAAGGPGTLLRRSLVPGRVGGPRRGRRLPGASLVRPGRAAEPEGGGGGRGRGGRGRRWGTGRSGARRSRSPAPGRRWLGAQRSPTRGGFEPAEGASSPAPGLRVLPRPSRAERRGRCRGAGAARRLPPAVRAGCLAAPVEPCPGTAGACAASPIRPPPAFLPAPVAAPSPLGRPGRAVSPGFSPGFSPAAARLPRAPARSGSGSGSIPVPGAGEAPRGSGGRGRRLTPVPSLRQGGPSEGARGPRQDVPAALLHPPRLRGHREQWVSAGLPQPCPACSAPGVLQPRWHQAGVPTAGHSSPRAPWAPGAGATAQCGTAGLWAGTGALSPGPQHPAPGERVCPCSQEPSPDSEGALHTSFHQLIQEQSSLVEASLELEMQTRGRGKALQPQPGWDGDHMCAQGHLLSQAQPGLARACAEAVAKTLVGAN